ncbi:MAG: cobalamin-binding protein [Thermodesulfobacteriota bacterium]
MRRLILIILILLMAKESFAFERIISLAPSVTETLFALGLEDQIVGVTDFCDWPPEAKAKPKIGGIINPSFEAIMRLRPDLAILTTDGNPKEIEEKLNGLGIKTFVFDGRSIHRLPDEIRRLGATVEANDKAEKLAVKIEASVIALKKPFSRKTALFIVWPEPLVVAGKETAINEAMEILGLKNAAFDSFGPYPKFSIEEALRRSPDVIFLGAGMGAIGDIKKVSESLLEKLKNTNAVKNKRVYYISEKILRTGPRFIEGMEEMDEFLDKK